MTCLKCGHRLAPAGNCEQCARHGEPAKRIDHISYDRKTGVSTFTFADGTKEKRLKLLG